MAIEEAIYTAKRVISGLKPGSVDSVVSASAVEDGDKVVVSCSMPSNSPFAGVKVIRKVGSYPIGQNDGTQIGSVAKGTNFSYNDTTVLMNVTYYYGFFPFTSDGIYPHDAAKVIRIQPKLVQFYGFLQNFLDLDPGDTISYPSNVKNYGFAKMLTNEGEGAATAGDWLDFLQNVLKNKPYAVKTNGRHDYALNPANYAVKVDGTNSDYQNTSYAGGMFAWLNKIYMHEEYSSNGNEREVLFATGPSDGFEPLGFVDGDDNVLEGLWLPMGYMDANGKTLVTGTTPVSSKTCAEEKAIIDSFSNRARFLGGPIINVLRDLEYMLFKSTDIQKAAGYGRCNAYSQDSTNSYNRLVNNGNVPGFKGTSDKTSNNKMFHSQVLGTYGQWLRDPYTLLINGQLYVSPKYQYNLSGVNPTGKTRATGGWYYPGKMEKIAGFGSIGLGNDGTTATGLCDGHYYNASGTRVAVRFGDSNGDLMDGPEALVLNDEATHTGWGCGVGLLLLPPAGYTPEE